MERLDKIAFRLDLAASEDLDVYEIILVEDRKKFDSAMLYNGFSSLPDETQRQIQVGYQFVGRYAHHACIVGEFASAHFGVLRGELPDYVTYLTFNFEKFNAGLTRVAGRKKLTLDYSTEGDDVYIHEYRSRIVGERLISNVLRAGDLRTFFGYRMNVALCEIRNER